MPPNHGWKIKTQLPDRTHIGTAATINDHKTAHKHSSLAPFQTYNNTKKRSASGGLRLLTPWPGALPLDPAGGTAIIGSRSALAICPPPISTPGSAPGFRTSTGSSTGTLPIYIYSKTLIMREAAAWSADAWIRHWCSESRDPYFWILPQSYLCKLAKLGISNFVYWLIQRTTSACMIY